SIERGPYTVVEAADGEEALARVGEQRPDLILLDVELPRMDGFAVCQRLKADPATRGIKVVMLTAAVQTEDRAKARAAGADDYVTKPFSLAGLLTLLGGKLEP